MPGQVLSSMQLQGTSWASQTRGWAGGRAALAGRVWLFIQSSHGCSPHHSTLRFSDLIRIQVPGPMTPPLDRGGEKGRSIHHHPMVSPPPDVPDQGLKPGCISVPIENRHAVIIWAMSRFESALAGTCHAGAAHQGGFSFCRRKSRRGLLGNAGSSAARPGGPAYIGAGRC